MKLVLTLIFILSFFLSFSQNNTACADTSYRMRFSSPGKDFTFFTHCNTADGGTVLIGRIIDITDSTSDLVIIKLSATGQVVWKTKYQIPANTRGFFSKILEQSNGEIAAYGYLIDFNASGTRKMIIVKWNSGGGLLWTNNYYLSNHFSSDDLLHPYFLSEGLNNDLLFSFNGEHVDTIDSFDDSTYAVVTRINNNGNVIWSKVFVGTENYNTHPSGVYQYNGAVYAFGYSESFNSNCNSGAMTASLYAMRLDYETGNILQLKTYCNGGGINSGIEWYQGFGLPERDAFNSVKLLNNQFALFGNFSQIDQKRYSYKILLNDQLNIVQAQQYIVAVSLSNRT